MSQKLRPNPLVHIPPPLVFVLSFLAGAALERWWMPLHLWPDAIVPVTRVLGFGLAIGGLGLMFAALALFLYQRTTVIPHRHASKLVERGPYRFTRNPMYLGLVLAYLGACGIFTLLWSFILLPIPLWFVNRIMVPFEEARLRHIFGANYEAYCNRVRRWL